MNYHLPIFLEFKSDMSFNIFPFSIQNVLVRIWIKIECLYLVNCF